MKLIHILLLFWLQCLPIFTQTVPNFLISFHSAFDVNKPIVFKQLSTQETVFATQNTDGTYQFSTFYPSGEVLQYSLTLTGTRSEQSLQGLTNGNFALVWDESDGSNGANLHAQIYDKTLKPVTSDNPFFDVQSQCCPQPHLVRQEQGFSVFYHNRIGGNWNV